MAFGIRICTGPGFEDAIGRCYSGSLLGNPEATNEQDERLPVSENAPQKKAASQDTQLPCSHDSLYCAHATGRD